MRFKDHWLKENRPSFFTKKYKLKRFQTVIWKRFKSAWLFVFLMKKNAWCQYREHANYDMPSEGFFFYVLKVKCVTFWWSWLETIQWGCLKNQFEVSHFTFNFYDCFPPLSQQRDTYMITLTGAGGTGQRGGGRGGWRDERGRRGLWPACGLPRDVTHLTTITSGSSLAKNTGWPI